MSGVRPMKMIELLHSVYNGFNVHAILVIMDVI